MPEYQDPLEKERQLEQHGRTHFNPLNMGYFLYTLTEILPQNPIKALGFAALIVAKPVSSDLFHFMRKEYKNHPRNQQPQPNQNNLENNISQ